MPPPHAQLGPPRNQEEVDVDSAMDVVTPAQNDIRCAFSLGITDEDAPSDKISVKPVISSRECVQLGLGGEPGSPPSSRGPKRRRDLSVEDSKRRMKKNGKAKMDGSDSVDVDASKEDSPSGGSRLSDLKGFHQIY